MIHFHKCCSLPSSPAGVAAAVVVVVLFESYKKTVSPDDTFR